MSLVTYAILSFTEKDLDRLFARCQYKGLSKFRRTDALRKLLWKHTGAYFEAERRPGFDLERDIDSYTETVMDFLVNKITKEQFILEILEDRNFTADLYTMLKQKELMA